MRDWNRWIAATSILMPAHCRADAKEQWQADMRGARELGISRIGLASSMLMTAVSAFWNHPSPGRTSTIVTLSIVLLVSASLIPVLAIVYAVIGLFMLALVNVRRGQSQLKSAVIGMVVIVGSVASLATFLREQLPSAIGLSFSLTVFIGAVIAVARSFTLAFATRTPRPDAVKLTAVSLAVAAIALAVATTIVSIGIRITNSMPPGTATGSVYGVVASVAIATFLVSSVTAIVAGVRAVPRMTEHSTV